VPRPPYRIEAGDVLIIQAVEALPNQPISGPFPVGPDGKINLGFNYGAVNVGGLTLEEAQKGIPDKLQQSFKKPAASVSLAQFRGMQQIRGEHIVQQDGSVGLGLYGSVCVAGLTVCQAKHVIEQHLTRFLLNPEISVTVAAFNSKVFYVITDGAGFGEQVYRFPITGNETVLDGISLIQGLPAQASTKYIWVARPAPPQHGCDQVLPVDWKAITQGGATATNYQLFPGDRIYVRADCFIKTDNMLLK